MKTLITLFVLWVLGSYFIFSCYGSKYIIPYAVVTMGLFALAVWQATKKKRAP